jgi:hypothetical protein
MSKVELNEDKISRIEIINHAVNSHGIGRLLTVYKDIDFDSIEIAIQDGGRTLKIFLDSSRPEIK